MSEKVELSPVSHPCLVCGVTVCPARFCNECGVACYCSDEHAQHAWERGHAKVCAAWRASRDRHEHQQSVYEQAASLTPAQKDALGRDLAAEYDDGVAAWTRIMDTLESRALDEEQPDTASAAAAARAKIRNLDAFLQTMLLDKDARVDTGSAAADMSPAQAVAHARLPLIMADVLSRAQDALPHFAAVEERFLATFGPDDERPPVEASSYMILALEIERLVDRVESVATAAAAAAAAAHRAPVLTTATPLGGWWEYLGASPVVSTTSNDWANYQCLYEIAFWEAPDARPQERVADNVFAGLAAALRSCKIGGPYFRAVNKFFLYKRYAESPTSVELLQDMGFTRRPRYKEEPTDRALRVHNNYLKLVAKDPLLVSAVHTLLQLVAVASSFLVGSFLLPPLCDAMWGLLTTKLTPTALQTETNDLKVAIANYTAASTELKLLVSSSPSTGAAINTDDLTKVTDQLKLAETTIEHFAAFVNPLAYATRDDQATILTADKHAYLGWPAYNLPANSSIYAEVVIANITAARGVFSWLSVGPLLGVMGAAFANLHVTDITTALYVTLCERHPYTHAWQLSHVVVRFLAVRFIKQAFMRSVNTWLGLDVDGLAPATMPATVNLVRRAMSTEPLMGDIEVTAVIAARDPTATYFERMGRMFWNTPGETAVGISAWGYLIWNSLSMDSFGLSQETSAAFGDIFNAALAFVTALHTGNLVTMANAQISARNLNGTHIMVMMLVLGGGYIAVSGFSVAVKMFYKRVLSRCCGNSPRRDRQQAPAPVAVPVAPNAAKSRRGSVTPTREEEIVANNKAKKDRLDQHDAIQRNASWGLFAMGMFFFFQMYSPAFRNWTG